MKTVLYFLIAAALFAFSCKKNNGSQPAPDLPYRIKNIYNGSEYKNFTYDNQGRVSNIDFNNGYYQFTYAANEITVQTYFSNGTPDPNWKYLFTTEGGKIKKGSRYLSNGAVGRNYFFEYNNTGQLWTIYMSLLDFTGDETEDHRYYFSYDAQQLLNQVTYTRDNWSGNNIVKADSVSTAVTYYTEKPFIKWKQVGFDFFGSASGGIQLTGLEIIPFSFLFLENIIMSDKAVQSIDTKKYKWNSSTTSWSVASANNRAYSETDYEYNSGEMLVKYKNIAIVWEQY
ncbi:MAG: hypothetical protein QM668_20120 [Agriterribacter sp.]